VKRARLLTALGLLIPFLVVAPLLTQLGILNPGQEMIWLAFAASLTALLAYLAVITDAHGEHAAPDSPEHRRWAARVALARTAFVVQWLALVGCAVFLWWILFSHDYRYQYVASYTSTAMPARYVYAAFWGGQEGTFVLWALITASIALVLMRWKHHLQHPAMFFVNLPLVMLTLVSVKRGPFLMFPPGQAPADGNGLNPLLQDWWMTIHPPVLFIGFSSFVFPFAIACAALLRRDYDGWVKPVLPWAVFSSAIQATGFIMGGVWAYKVLGWGGYWGWDPVENGSLIPWLTNIALVHGLLVQRVTGALRKTNFVLAITSYVLVLYASFLTRSGVLADFSVHSFANLGLSGFLLAFIAVGVVVGFGLVAFRWREIPASPEPLGSFSRESFLWLGQLVFILMCALISVGMSAPLITKLFGPPSNVQTSYYNLVNAPLAIAMGLLLGVGPLMRWRQQEASPLLRAIVPSAVFAVLFTLLAVFWGVRDPMPVAVVFSMAFALAANLVVTVRGFRTGWKHGIAYLGHLGVSVLLIGVIASSNYGVAAQVQLPKGEAREALGLELVFQGMERDNEGKDHAIIAVKGQERNFTANTRFFWSEYNQGYMKAPHVENFLTHDVYISPLEMVGRDGSENGVWMSPGESRTVGEVTWTLQGLIPQPTGEGMTLTAELVGEIGGRTVPARPVLEVRRGQQSSTPDYLPGGGQVSIVGADPQTGRVRMMLPGMGESSAAEVLAVEVSTKPFINLVWLGSVLMLAATFMVVVRRVQDLRRTQAA
jgi:cytochrome c-type biogenesis protein CcmF